MPAIQPESGMSERGRFVDGFRRDGFGIIRGALGAADVDHLQQILLKMLADASGAANSLEVHLPRIIEMYPDVVVPLATAPPLLATLTDIFGTVPHLAGSYGHVKPAGTGAHTRVHSDVAHLRGVPHGDSTLMVKVMYALTLTAQGSGATFVHPGTHRSPSGPEQHESSDGVYLHLDPGDLQIFHANIQHTATPNTGSTPRLSLWCVYAQPWMRVFPGHEHGEALLSTLRPKIEAYPALADVFGLSNPYSSRQ